MKSEDIAKENFYYYPLVITRGFSCCARQSRTTKARRYATKYSGWLITMVSMLVIYHKIISIVENVIEKAGNFFREDSSLPEYESNHKGIRKGQAHIVLIFKMEHLYC